MASVTLDLGDDLVGVVTLRRADKRNALNHDLFAGLHAAAEQAAAAISDGRCRAVLLLGEGPVFCAGLDLEVLAEQVQAFPGADELAWMQQAFTGFEDLAAPVIAAVQGAAVGAGCQLALACHLRVATPDARFGLLEATWGLVPDLGASYRLPRLVGLGRATELAVEAGMIDAATALAWGLVNHVLDTGDLAGAARAYTAALARGPAPATGMIPGLLRAGLESGRDAALAAERVAQARAGASEEFRATVRQRLGDRA